MFASVNRRGRVIAVAAGAVLAMTPMASAGASSTPTTERAEPAPLVGTDSPDAIAGRYIVVLDDDAAAARQEVSAIAAAAGGTITSTYDSALAGFAGALPVAAVEQVRAAAGVAFVEADTRVSVPTPVGEAEQESGRRPPTTSSAGPPGAWTESTRARASIGSTGTTSPARASPCTSSTPGSARPTWTSAVERCTASPRSTTDAARTTATATVPTWLERWGASTTTPPTTSKPLGATATTPRPLPRPDRWVGHGVRDRSIAGTDLRPDRTNA